MRGHFSFGCNLLSAARPWILLESAAMPRRWRPVSGAAVVLAAIVLAAVGCGGSTTAPSRTAASHADVADPVGDVASDPRVPVPPDLLHATIDTDAGNLTLVVALAPGSLNRQTTRVSALLDTDQNASTGIRQADGVGADYALDLAAGTGQTAVTRADEAGCAAHSSCFNPIGSIPIAFVGDQMQVVVPLAMLGSPAGHTSFRLSSYILVAPLTPVIFDWMPDSNLPPGRTQ